MVIFGFANKSNKYVLFYSQQKVCRKDLMMFT